MNKWKKVTIPEWRISTYSCKANKLYCMDEYWTTRFIPRKLCRFVDNEWIVSYLPNFDFADDLEKLAADWEDFKKFKAIRDKIGEMIDWDDEIMLAYETERKAESNPQKRAEIDQKYLTNYAS